MSVTIKTIAKLAGVSTATVSRYLNNPETVSEKRREILAKVIESQNYKRNEVARSLIINSSNVVGVILPDINNIYFPPIMQGIEEKLDECGFSTLICSTHGNIKKEKSYIDTLLGHRVAGIIFIGTRPEDPASSTHIAELAEKLPVLLVNDYLPDTEINFIANDEANGIESAIRYLKSMGHQEIGFVNGRPGMTTYKYKYDGYIRTMKDLGLDHDSYYLETEPYEYGGYSAVSSLLKLGHMPTAFVTANDQMAIGVLRAVMENGYRVPEDISVIGFSNVPIAKEVFPPLSTVNQQPFLTGMIAADTIVQLISKQRADDSFSGVRIWLDTGLIIRKSSGYVNNRES